jgi:hypothetical protein
MLGEIMEAIIAGALVGILGAGATLTIKFLPAIKEWVTKFVVEKFVYAAEQLFKQSGLGPDKKNWVLEQIDKFKFKFLIVMDSVDDWIENIVGKINANKKEIAESIADAIIKDADEGEPVEIDEEAPNADL